MESHELAKMLLEQPNCKLIMQKDAEGNGYSPLYGIEFDVVYVPEESYYGYVYRMEDSADDNCMDEEDWENAKRDHSGYAVLYPIN